MKLMGNTKLFLSPLNLLQLPLTEIILGSAFAPRFPKMVPYSQTQSSLPDFL